jgi:hypothetical protein
LFHIASRRGTGYGRASNVTVGSGEGLSTWNEVSDGDKLE